MSELYIWRYMSLAKYVDLLRSKSIFCPKASLFEDDTEGKWIAHAILWEEKQRWQLLRCYADQLQNILDLAKGDQNTILREAERTYQQLPPEEANSVLGDVLKTVPIVHSHMRGEYLCSMIKGWIGKHDSYNTNVSKWMKEVTADRTSTFISCWNRAASMSLAMWNIYGGGQESVAIKLKTGKLESLLQDNITWLKENGLDGQIVDVEYVEGLNRPEDELRRTLIKKLGVGKDVRVGSFSIKPALYSYENEVRLIIYPNRDHVSPGATDDPDVSGIALSIKETENGLSDFIEAIHVHPLLDSNSMMVRVVGAINEQFGLPNLPIITDKVEAIGPSMSLEPTGYTGV